MTHKEKNMENLIRNLISALNGEAYEEAKVITDQIIATGDEELIKQAEYINSVL
jgi:protein-arginine kinase activator protein McsA